MEPTVLAGFAAVTVMLIMLPGPDWALVLATSTRSPGAVAPTVAGLAIGYAVITTVVVAGVAPLVAAAPAAMLVLTTFGALYLLYLGTSILRSSGAPDPGHSPAPPAPRHSLVRGIGVSALNPKSLLFFVAFLPQFAQPSAAWPLGVQLAALGGIWIAIATVLYTFLGYSAGHALSARPGRARLITRIAGVGMLLAGIVLLTEQLLHRL